MSSVVGALDKMKKSVYSQNSSKTELQGSSVGQRSIAQAISALQQYMKQHQHEPVYANSPETPVMLRQQDWVKVYEKKAAVNEAQRRKNAHTTKAKGTSSAFRGDSTRRVLWSDFFWKSIPVPLIGEDTALDALVILADQSKTNSTGRIDEHGLFRHRHVELCGFGAIGFHFFSHFHIEKKAPPSFTPDFEDSEFSENGRRDWYGVHLFSGGRPEPEKQHGMTPMTYENHQERIKRMHSDNGVQISAVTHGGRFYAANKAESHGAEEADVKTLGNWKVGDAYEEVYKRKLPVKAMLASAMFNAENLPSYVLPRGHLVTLSIVEPPSHLLALLFPWVECELTAYHDRVLEHGNKAVDLALKNFLELLVKLPTVILQDAAVLYTKSPSAPLWPFNSPEFRTFSASSVSILEQAEAEAKRKLQCLPKTVAASMRRILESIEFQANAINPVQLIEKADSPSSSRKEAVSQQQPNSQAHNSSPSPESHTPIIVPSTQEGVGSLPSTTLAETVPQSSNFMHRVSPSTALQLVAQALDDPYWPPDLLSLDLRSSFVLSTDGYDRGRQIESIRKLVIKYGVEKISHHQFEWIKTVRSTPDERLPIYEFNRNVKTIQELWDEWTVGLNGCLSIRQLDDGWDARWRRNVSGQKTEAARRKVIINLHNRKARRETELECFSCTSIPK
ncbi:hypothetical protein CVT26_015407 [Gymnopilus dilepis]|uniref:Ndc10 domain-containing protein n=1 Tax=Gymnopilus dilepis TaxID=231916 RepID=A0A409YE98_9AGAR|nr:hypothetical protein CVT26_015407 [Gymnopilus dilepis]